MKIIVHQLRHGLGSAHKKGNHLKVRAKCPRSVKPRDCHMRIVGQLNRHGPKMTNVRKAHLGAGRARRLRFKLKHGYTKKVAHRKHIVLKERVRIGHHRYTVTKSVRLIHH